MQSKNVAKNSKKPTENDYRLIATHIRMEDWHFNIIRERCTIISIHEFFDGRCEYKDKAIVYGLKGKRVSSQEEMIANIFIRLGERVYQAFSLIEIGNILQALEKVYRYIPSPNDFKSPKKKKK